MYSIMLLWLGFHVKLGKLHCPKFSPTRITVDYLAATTHQAAAATLLCLFEPAPYVSAEVRRAAEAGWINNNKEADWAASKESNMTGGANPGSPRLLFAASVQGLVGLIHHSIKKKEYIDGFDLNILPLV